MIQRQVVKLVQVLGQLPVLLLDVVEVELDLTSEQGSLQDAHWCHIEIEGKS